MDALFAAVEAIHRELEVAMFPDGIPRTIRDPFRTHGTYITGTDPADD